MAQKGVFLARTDFPMYCIKMLGDKNFLVAGGGGATRSGIPNAIEIYELRKDNESEKYIASKINHFDTNRAAVMNCAVHQSENLHHLATGQDEKCQLYSLRTKVIALRHHDTNIDQGIRNESIRRRKSNFTRSHEYAEAEKTMVYDLEVGHSAQTDFQPGAPYQKVVVFSPDLSLVFTGGTDGCVRAWQYPSLVQSYEIRAHKDEIDDMCINPTGAFLCTTSKDHRASIWKLSDKSKVCDLTWTLRTNVDYKVRGCRYASVPDKPDQTSLFTIHIPVVRSTRPDKSYLALWDTKSYVSNKIVSTGTEALCSIAVSSDGVYVAVGAIAGSVSVYISFSLQRLYHVREAHSIFVTGLEFTPETLAVREMTGSQVDFTLLSISADNSIRIHQQPARYSFHPIWLLVALAISIYLVFWLMAYLQL